MPNDELWSLFCELSSEITTNVVNLLEGGLGPIMVMLRGAYGLKDAVLLWYLAFSSAMCSQSLGWRRAVHDQATPHLELVQKPG